MKLLVCVTATAVFGKGEFREEDNFSHVSLFHNSPPHCTEIPDKWPLLLSGGSSHHTGSEEGYLRLSCKQAYCILLNSDRKTTGVLALNNSRATKPYNQILGDLANMFS